MIWRTSAAFGVLSPMLSHSLGCVGPVRGGLCHGLLWTPSSCLAHKHTVEQQGHEHCLMLSAGADSVGWGSLAAGSFPDCLPWPWQAPAALFPLPQVELCRQLLAHGAQRQEGSHDLGQEEGQEQAVHCQLQRQAQDLAVRQQEEQEWELDQEGEQEEPGQFRHLQEQSW